MATFGAVLLVFIFGTLFSISNGFQTCNGPWKRVYENDAQGVGIMGNQADLFEAQQRGAKIRYLLPALGEAGYADELDNVLVYENIMCGQSVLHASKDRWDHFHDDGQWRFVVICTDGRYQTYTYISGSNSSINETFSKERIVWFVQESTWPIPVYSHLKDGTAVKGSKEELKNSVLSGYDVKFHLKDYFFILHSDNIEISADSGEVVAQNIWAFNLENNARVERSLKMIRSDGSTDTLIWNLGEDVKIQHNIIQAAVDWFSDPCWRLAFTNDENGFQKAGSLANLIAAVEVGQRVKVVVGTYSIELDNVRSDWGQVSGQLLSRVSKNDSNTFSDDAFWVWQMVHSTGAVRTRRYNIDDVTNRGDTREKKTISWYVDTRPWRKVLSTNKNGDVVFGSKADLKNAIENGASVRVGLQFGRGGRTGLRRGQSRSGGRIINGGGDGGSRNGFKEGNVRLDRILGRGKERMGRLEGMFGRSKQRKVHLKGILGDSKERKGHLKGILGDSKERKGNLKGILGDSKERKVHLKVILGDSKERKGHLKGILGDSQERKGRLEGLLVRSKETKGRLRGITGRRKETPSRHQGMWSRRKERKSRLESMWSRHKERKSRKESMLASRKQSKASLTGMLLRHKERHGRLTGMLLRHKERHGRLKRELRRRMRHSRLGAMMGRHGDKHGGSFVWDGDSNGWFVMKAGNVELGPDGEVAAELIRSVSTEVVRRKEFQIKDDPFWRFMVVTTQGNVDISQWRVGAHIDDGHFSEKANINWYVNY